MQTSKSSREDETRESLRSDKVRQQQKLQQQLKEPKVASTTCCCCCPCHLVASRQLQSELLLRAVACRACSRATASSSKVDAACWFCSSAQSSSSSSENDLPASSSSTTIISDAQATVLLGCQKLCASKSCNNCSLCCCCCCRFWRNAFVMLRSSFSPPSTSFIEQERDYANKLQRAHSECKCKERKQRKARKEQHRSLAANNLVALKQALSSQRAIAKHQAAAAAGEARDFCCCCCSLHRCNIKSRSERGEQEEEEKVEESDEDLEVQSLRAQRRCKESYCFNNSNSNIYEGQYEGRAVNEQNKQTQEAKGEANQKNREYRAKNHRNQGNSSKCCCFYDHDECRANARLRRRLTFASRLIELFEQQAGVNAETPACNHDGHDDDRQQQQHDDSLTSKSKQQDDSRREQQATAAACAETIARRNECFQERVTRGNKISSGSSRARECSREEQEGASVSMRDIITPVKYEHDDESSGTSATPVTEQSDESYDSLEPLHIRAASELAEATTAAAVAPATRDAAADDDGDDQPEDSLDYQQRRAECCVRHHKSAATNMSTRSPIERIRSCGAVRVLPRDEQANVALHKRLTRTNWQAPTDARKYEIGTKTKSKKRNQTTKDKTRPIPSPLCASERLSTSSTWGAPQVIKHEASSSRRLLKQLAKLRAAHSQHQSSSLQGSSSSRRRKRPESVARIEELIEQLERVTREWDEDEHLLDRAERRDFSSQLETRLRNKESEATKMNLSALEQQEEDLLNFGCRSGVPSLETQSIERSHRQRGGGNVNQRESHKANTLDRRADDLAVRRLAPKSSGSTRATPPLVPQTSYLLCVNANGAPEPVEAADAQRGAQRISSRYRDYSLERRLRQDDLHYRRVTRHLAPPSPELPFGIPRNQSTRQLARLSASERLAAQAPSVKSNPFLGSECCDWDERKNDDTREEGEEEDASRLQPKSTATSTRRSTTTTKQTTTTTSSSGTLTTLTTQRKMTQEEEEEEILDEICGNHQKRSPEEIIRENRRSDSRVSFASDHLKSEREKDRRRFGGSASADSGVNDVGVATGDNSAHSPGVTSPTLSAAQSPLSFAKYDAAQDLDDDLELDVELALCSPISCESPVPERLQAELTSTPVRRRPRINIDAPRAKSPLVRVGSMRRPLIARVGRERDIVAAVTQLQRRDSPRKEEKVVIQTYGDSWGRRQERRKGAVSEIECQYEFYSTEDDEDGEQDFLVGGARERAHASRLRVKTYESSESSPNDGASGQTDDDETSASLRQLDSAIDAHSSPVSPRGREIISIGSATPELNLPRGIRPRSRVETLASGAPKFSIGPYRTHSGTRKNLIIL